MVIYPILAAPIVSSPHRLLETPQNLHTIFERSHLQQSDVSMPRVDRLKLHMFANLKTRVSVNRIVLLRSVALVVFATSHMIANASVNDPGLEIHIWHSVRPGSAGHEQCPVL